MPWNPRDAKVFTEKADTPDRQRTWARVANAALERGKDEGTAVRLANATVAKAKKREEQP